MWRNKYNSKDKSTMRGLQHIMIFEWEYFFNNQIKGMSVE